MCAFKANVFGEQVAKPTESIQTHIWKKRLDFSSASVKREDDPVEERSDQPVPRVASKLDGRCPPPPRGWDQWDDCYRYYTW